MKDKIIRVYPIRTTRKKWNINLFKNHICTQLCNIKLETNNENELIIKNNPNFKNGKCEEFNTIKKTLIHMSTFNTENGHIDENGILCNLDMKVIPDNSFKICIYYPLSYSFDIVISTNTYNGFTLRELIKYIKTLYEFIYNEEERTATPQVFTLKKYCFSCDNKNFDKYIENIDSPDGDCCICCNEYKNDSTVAKLKCKHIFHNECIKTWFNTNGTCPFCRCNVFECKNCDGSGIIYYQFTGTVIPLEERGINLNRNLSNGIFGIYNFDLDDLLLQSLSYDRIKKQLYINIIS